jgi:signal transduction histidine kinase
MQKVEHAGKDFAYLTLGLLTGILAFTLTVTLWSVVVSTIWIIIGLPIAFVALLAVRGLAEVERKRTGWFTGRAPVARYKELEGHFLNRLWIIVRDEQIWRDQLWLLLLGPISLFDFVVMTVLWGTVLGSIFMPAWWWTIDPGPNYGIVTIDSPEMALLATAFGLALVPIAYWITRLLADKSAWLGTRLLSGGLTARVEELTESRAGAVNVAAADLERLERDLHDGAQARLVALAMNLGMADDKFEGDPQAARELVGEARVEAKRALAELRDLARGMRPSLLVERGLGPALEGLAARSSLPAGARISVPDRLPPAVENAAYFVVAEALANAGKHSGAQRATVSAAMHNGSLHVEISDDGHGGADPQGHGLRGLAQRVAAIDGRLTVESPQGGPTIVRAELPCA